MLVPWPIQCDHILISRLESGNHFRSSFVSKNIFYPIPLNICASKCVYIFFSMLTDGQLLHRHAIFLELKIIDNIIFENFTILCNNFLCWFIYHFANTCGLISDVALLSMSKYSYGMFQILWLWRLISSLSPFFFSLCYWIVYNGWYRSLLQVYEKVWP